ncbi:hypothetical protein [Bradyrhizobium sp. NP1]|nr:hypothetical protein [Bradyrhizobium sp. NP1]WJR77228.1 hypothetical protein QOU61_31590 [Bradyrhizobium sp. NP1]
MTGVKAGSLPQGPIALATLAIAATIMAIDLATSPGMAAGPQAAPRPTPT